MRKGQYDFRQLAKWTALLPIMTEDLPDVGFFATSKRDNRIVISVKTDNARREMEERLTMHEVPLEAVRFRMSGPTERHSTLTSYTPWLRAGFRIWTAENYRGNQSLCTMGPTGVGESSSYSGDYFLTASHCTPTLYWNDQVAFGQPGSADGIGEEEKDGFDWHGRMDGP